jgi:hypothetical protein
MNVDRTTGFSLLETGTLVEFEISRSQVHEGPDPAEFSLEIDLVFPPDPESEENDLEWGAFGFLFVIGVLSFADARPREASIIEYAENDEFQVGDLIQCLRWEGGALRFSADYIRGRRMKTDVVLRSEGFGRLTTVGRGKAPLLWLERLKGKKLLQIVPGQPGK